MTTPTTPTPTTPTASTPPAASADGEPGGVSGGDVASVAYRASGARALIDAGAGAPVGESHLLRQQCARCERTGTPMTAVREVLPPWPRESPERNHAVISWARPRGRVLCPGCTWMYRTAQLRVLPHVISRGPDAITVCSPQFLFTILAAQLPDTVAVTVPTDGQVDLLPTAVWGSVSTPGLVSAWTAADADRLTIMARLRVRGFTAHQLASPVPDDRTLRRLPARRWENVLTEWSLLDPWRASAARWHVGLRATDVARSPSERRPVT